MPINFSRSSESDPRRDEAATIPAQGPRKPARAKLTPVTVKGGDDIVLPEVPPAPPKNGHTSLGNILLERKLISDEQLTAAIARQKRTGRRLGHVLVDMGLATPDEILAALGAQLNVRTTRVNAYTVQPDAVSALPEKVARKHTAFPITRIGSTLVVAIATPKDLNALDDLRFASGCEIQTTLALEDEINAALDCYYRDEWLSAQEEETSGTVVLEAASLQLTTRDEEAERSAVRIVERIISRAAADGASDIHFEPMPDTLRVRFRVDGAFRDAAELLNALAPAIIARIKVLAGMDIAEHRIPQDGRFSATVGQRHLDLRSSTYPTLFGEKAVLRVLDRSSVRLSLDGVGISPQTLERYRELIRRPEGILLITGPTGSGKTSTLYATLGELVETGKNIMTIENPVEYAIPGTNQGQINEKAGFTFAKGLRAILRQDPDIIMVGEIRDLETLETAIEASLTGHLVFSTLHTNSAVATVARLLEMGLEPYLMSSSIIAIVAQRLVRRLCRTCRSEVPMPEGLRHLFRSGELKTFYRGSGCKDCRGTGFKGRIGIIEMLEITPQMRELILTRAPEATILELARSQGMMTLREECLNRVAAGETTLEEVLRVTQER
jgi:type IV pilus assembly protein PilB